MRKVFIVGFGKFGRRILLNGRPIWKKSQIWIIDNKPDKLPDPGGVPFLGIRVLGDGPRFLSLFQNWIDDKDLIVPAVPIHLAWSWLKLNLPRWKKLTPVTPPRVLGERLPFCFLQNEGLYLSYADFLCPENCPAPEHYCYQTKKRRGVPLWKLLKDQKFEKGSLKVIESQQIGPGIGGYPFKELRRIRDQALRSASPFFVATACRCHGVVHGASWREYR